jgi:hypothetical protein
LIRAVQFSTQDRKTDRIYKMKGKLEEKFGTVGGKV